MVNNVELFSDAKASKALPPRSREEGIKKAKAAYEENPDSIEAITAYAEALFNGHQFEESVNILVRACELCVSPDITYNLAFVYAVLGKNEDAKKIYRKVITMAAGTSLAKSAEYELWKMGEQIDAKWLKR